MHSTKYLVVAAGIASWVLLTILGKQKHHQMYVDKKLYKTELSTWEVEGGNLPPKIIRSVKKTSQTAQ